MILTNNITNELKTILPKDKLYEIRRSSNSVQIKEIDTELTKENEQIYYKKITDEEVKTNIKEVAKKYNLYEVV